MRRLGFLVVCLAACESMDDGDSGRGQALRGRGDLVAVAEADAVEPAVRWTRSEQAAAARDSDRDGLNDLEEIYEGTDPGEADSDFDGLGDLAELDLGTAPDRADTDGDGLVDVEELELGLDPKAADTDADGFGDLDELRLGQDPRDTASHPASAPDRVLPRLVSSTLARQVRAAITRNRYDARFDVNADGRLDEVDVELAVFLSNRRNIAGLQRTAGEPELRPEDELPGTTDADPCDRVAQVSVPVARFFERESDEAGDAPEFALRVLSRIALADFNENGCDGDGDGQVDLLVDQDGDGVPEGLDTDGDGQPDTQEDAGKEKAGEEGCCYEPICQWLSTVPPDADTPGETDTGLQSVDYFSYDERHRKYAYGPTHLMYSYRGAANCLAGDTGSHMSMASKGLSYLHVNLKCSKPEGTRCEKPCRECTAKGSVMGSYHSILEVTSEMGLTCWPVATNRADVAAADAAAVTLCGDAKVDGDNLSSGDTVTIEKSLTLGLEVGKDKDGKSITGAAEVSFGESRVLGSGSHSGEVDVFHSKDCFPIEATITSAGKTVNNTSARAMGISRVRTSYRGMAAKATSACMPNDFSTWFTHGFDTADGIRLRDAWLASH